VRSNLRILVALQASHLVLFPIPVITLFFKDHLGMSVTDVMVLQAIFGTAAVLFEFPSGYVADRLGHRLSLIVSAVLGVLGWILYTLAEGFGGAILAEVTLAAGMAFFSGADAALLYESLEAEGRKDEYARWEGRGRAASQIGEAASSALGGWLYAIAPRLPFAMQVPNALLMLGLAFATREMKTERAPDHLSHVSRALAIVRSALRHRRLRASYALSVSLGLSTFIMVWLIQPYMQSRGLPEAWFGPLWAAAHFWLAGASLSSARIAAAVGLRTTLLGCALLVPLGYGLLAWADSPWGGAAYLFLMTLRGLQGPLLTSMIQRDASPDERASVLSLNALLFRLAFVLLGPPVGALVDGIGMEPTLAILAAVLGGASLLAWLAFAQAHGRET